MKNAISMILLVTIFALILADCGPSSIYDVTSTVSEITEVPEGRTIIVTNSNNSGSGSLRQAFLDAQRGDTISFASSVFPPTDPVIDYLSTGLPTIRTGTYFGVSSVIHPIVSIKARTFTSQNFTIQGDFP